MNRRTIAAITTPIGEGGISIIHVSGPASIEIVNKIFRGKRIKDLSCFLDGRLYYGTIEHNGTTVDEAVINIVRKDESFTGEDVVEINCHGGILTTRRVLDCVNEEGAIEVGWQELIAQSFENNKIDSIQQEALLELIKAKTTLAARVFLDQYKGALSVSIAECGISPHSAIRTPQSAFTTIERLLQTADFGIALASPLKVTIAGSPNAGKSTLINALLDKERVIVHHEPGTTRDAVTDIFSVDGMPFELTDTAGIRHTNDIIEGLAIKETIRKLSATDIAIIVFDNSRPLNEQHTPFSPLNTPLSPLLIEGKGDGGLSMPPYKHVEIIPVVNKIDLPSALNLAELQSYFSQPICRISALYGNGLSELSSRLVARFAHYTKYVPGRPIVFTERQRKLLLEIEKGLSDNKRR